MISLSHLYKTYPGPVHALRDIELQIEKGEFVFITGPSGAGKSTLFKMICGFDKPTSGRIQVAGYDLATIDPSDVPFLRRKIGVVFQDFKLLKGRTVIENVALPLTVQRERGSFVERRVQEVLDQVGLKFKAHSVVEQLSGGEQQRVAIARALIHKPGLLIADEPTGNLDPELSQEILALLETVNAQGTTVFVATHNHEMVLRSGHRRIEVYEGGLKTAEEVSVNI